MADLSVLIRLHKHELDEKRRALAALYGDMAMMERERTEMEEAFIAEKKAVDLSGDVHFTFASYAETYKNRREIMIAMEKEMERRIEAAKDSMMETFAELKKYEMTQAERDRLEEEERRIREARTLDDIGIEGFRRKSGEAG